MSTLDCTQPITDEQCDSYLTPFKTFDPNAFVLLKPSQTNGTCIITHQIPNAPPMQLNNATCKSPLCNNALYGIEKATTKDGSCILLQQYETMVPDMPGNAPELSTAQTYINALSRSGVDTTATHYHWTGAPELMAAVHSSSQTLSPEEFINKTLSALDPFKAMYASPSQ